MFETISLLPGVNLRCRTDPRFKQGCLSLHWVVPMCANHSAMNALIPSVLLRGTVPHPDLRSITARLDDLYGAAVSPMSRRVGDYQASGLYLSFMDDRFALPEYTRLFPPHWQHIRYLDSTAALGAALKEFWAG